MSARWMLAIILCLGRAAWADPCEAKLLLNPQQIEVLRSAARGTYEIEVLHGVIHGQERNVILLGERHVKNEADEKLGLEVIREFPHRGLEGARVSGWGLLVLLPLLPLARPLARLLISKDLNRGSTIDAARELSRAEIEAGFANIPLEMGHRSDTAENFHSLILAANIASHVSVAGGLLIALATQDWHPGLDLVCAGFGTGALFYAYEQSHAILKCRHSTKTWFKKFYSAREGLLTGRNATMVRNIHLALLLRPKWKQMLVIVGRAHVAGIRKLLNEQHGFKPVAPPPRPGLTRD